MHARDRAGGDGSRQARLRAEAADAGRSPKRGSSRARRQSTKRRDADGQPGPLAGTTRGRPSSTCGPARSATCAKCTSGRTGRSATGRRASRGPKRARRRRTASAGTAPASTARLATRDGGQLPDARRARVGSVPRRAPYVEYHPVYHPFNWRGWVDWGCGAIGDMGAHLIDSLDVGARPRLSRRRSKRVVDAVQRRLLPARDDDVLRVPRARRQAAGEADVVRRRPAAAEAGRDSATDESSSSDRRRAARRQQGQAAARHLRHEPAAAARRRCTTSFGTPAQKLPRIPTRTTR